MNRQQRLLFIGILIEEDENRNYVRLHRRNLRDTTNPFEVPDFFFKTMFRFDKPSTLELIHSVEPFLRQLLRRDTIPAHLKVLATLNFLGTGSYQNSVGCNNWLAISQTSLSRIIHEVCTVIADHLLQQWVKFCTTEEEKNSIKRGFYEKKGARGVIGCIDGTHVEIIAPPITDELHPPYVYINRKGKHSINVMLISDSDSKILACNARYPGSVHDSAIWQMSNIRRYLMQQFEAGDKYSHLIGDSGYPLEPWIFTPINNAPDGSAASRFNVEMCRVRNVIERTNGILKGRFRCLSKQRILMYHPAKAAKIIYTCCVLHNMALEARLPEPDYDYDEVVEEIGNIEQPIERNNDIFHLGRRAREVYIRNNIV